MLVAFGMCLQVCFVCVCLCVFYALYNVILLGNLCTKKTFVPILYHFSLQRYLLAIAQKSSCSFPLKQTKTKTTNKHEVFPFKKKPTKQQNKPHSLGGVLIRAKTSGR